MLTMIILLLSVFLIGLFLYSRRTAKSKADNLKQGDLAVIRTAYKKDFEDIPHNNVLHVIDVDDDFVKVEFINFRDGKYEQQKISKQYIRKVRRNAA